MINMEVYHGSYPNIIDKLSRGNIEVCLGGGEIGKGFYTGQYMYIAKAWAYHKHNLVNAKNDVLQINIDDNSFLGLDPHLLNQSETLACRWKLKRDGTQHTYVFNKNIVWAPIVGGTKPCGDQYKWESKDSEKFLNSNLVVRTRT